jgi:hypothetical protein
MKEIREDEERKKLTSGLHLLVVDPTFDVSQTENVLITSLLNQMKNRYVPSHKPET